MTDQTASLAPSELRPRFRAKPGLWTVQRNVLYALVLHDIKTRFFGNIYGYLATIVWPGLHLSFLIALHSMHLADKTYGDSVVLYASTGVMPFIAWNYISRFSMLGQSSNRSLLYYPIIQPLDLIVSRTFLEMITVFIILCLLSSFMMLIDINIMPRDLTQASLGFLSAILLGIGFGILGGVIAAWFPLMSFLWMFIIIVAHLFSGITVPIEGMPVPLQKICAYNPLLHTVEWIRVSYWNDYPAHLLSKRYVILFGLGAGFLGLALERMLRRNRRVKG